MNETRCERFEREGLLQLERGEPLDEHFETCLDCQAARRAYEALGERLRSPADERDARDLEPPGDWQARVLAGIARRSAARRRRRWLWWVVAPLAAALLVALGLRLASDSDDHGPPEMLASFELETSIRRGDTVFRGDAVRRGMTAQPGDRMRIETAGAGSVVHRSVQELRVYFNGRSLVARCGSPERAAHALIAECVRLDGRLALEVELADRGRYRAMALLTEDVTALGEPTGEGLDRDADAALAAGTGVRLGDPVVVR